MSSTEASKKRQHQSSNEEIDLAYLIRAIWDGKWLVGSVTTLFAVASVAFSLVLPNEYRAEALVAPAWDEGPGGGLASLASQYGGLANLAGINVSADRGGKTDVGIETLRSRKFITDFIMKNDILVPLIATKEWDEQSSELIIDSEIYDSVEGRWVREVSWPKETVPTAQEAYRAFVDLLSISEDKQTGFITISIKHYSPHVARDWVQRLIAAVNTEIMSRDVAEAERAIEYLQQQVNSTSLSQLQNVFFRLIEEQTKTVMLAKVSPEYVFRTIDPAVAPELKSSPKRAVIAIAGTMFGGFLSLILLFIKNVYRTEFAAR